MTKQEYKIKRNELGYTQAGLAHALGVSVTTISRRENGKNAITPEAIIAINSLSPCKELQ